MGKKKRKMYSPKFAHLRQNKNIKTIIGTGTTTTPTITPTITKTITETVERESIPETIITPEPTTIKNKIIETEKKTKTTKTTTKKIKTPTRTNKKKTTTK